MENTVRTSYPVAENLPEQLFERRFGARRVAPQCNDLGMDDEGWLAYAIGIATDNVSAGGGPFGAVIVRGDQAVAEGVNRVTRDNDPTAHAEVVAIRAAGRALETFDLTGLTLYTSCEPCPLCLSASLWARLDRVVYAADRDDAARAGFDDRHFYDLFSRHPDGWPLQLDQRRTPGCRAPFEAWRAHADRIDY